jgi:hypothetical protein
VAQHVEQHAQALGRIPIVVDHKDPQAAACRRGFVTVGSGGGPNRLLKNSIYDAR